MPMRSRAQSRVPSRAASPALSIKSRKSMVSSRNKRNSYNEPDDATDDEDSEDDRRSIRSGINHVNRRQRKNSMTSLSYDNEDDSEAIQKSKNRNSQRNTRSRRGGSVSKTTPSDWSTRRTSINTIRDHNERNSISSKKGYSDSPITPDSESEPAIKALVQAKIQEKITQQIKEQEAQNKQKSIENDDTINTTQQINNTTSANNNNNNHEIDETPLELDKIDDKPFLGPPPSAPDHEWECEFCTFVNEPNIKICAICCKTPTHIPKPIISTKNNDKIIETNTNKMNTIKISHSEEDSEDQHKKKGRSRKISFFLGTKSK